MDTHSSHQTGFAPLALAIFGILVLGAIAAGAFLITGRSTTVPAPSAQTTSGTGATNPTTGTTNNLPPATTQTGAAGESASGEMSGTIDELARRGASMECDIRSVPGAAYSLESGTLWTTAGKARSTINAKEPNSGMTMIANAIYAENNVHTWLSLNGSVVYAQKFDPASFAPNTTMTAEQKAQAEQYRNQLVVNCHPWIVDETKFVLPEGVTFTQM